MSRDNVIERIRKLLALSRSDNQHEATLAADRARSLMLDHDLQMVDLGHEDGRVTIDYYPNRRSPFPDWLECLFAAVAIHHDCKPLTEHHGKRWLAPAYFRFAVIGRKADIQAVNYVFHFLRRTVTRLAGDFRREHPRMKPHTIDQYRLGVVSGISVQLELLRNRDARLKSESGQALVLAKDVAIDRFIDEQEWDIRKEQNRKAKIVNPSVADAGFADGINVKITPAVDQEKSRKAINA